MGTGMDEHILASPGTRLGAVLLDGLVYLIGVIPFVVMAGLSGGGGDEVFAMLALIAPLVILVCVQWYLIATTGQTIGKRMLGIKIIKETGEDVDFVSGVIMRAWIPGAIGAIPLVGPIFNLVDPLMIFGDGHQCLHDRIASTKVISV